MSHWAKNKDFGFRKAEGWRLSARSSFSHDLGQVTEPLGASACSTVEMVPGT